MSQPEAAGGPPPVPVDAQFETPTMTVTVFFDRPLTPGRILSVNWGVRAFGREWIPIVVRAFTSAVSFEVVLGAFGLGERVSYFATPPDLLGLDSTPVERFIGFPLRIMGPPP